MSKTILITGASSGIGASCVAIAEHNNLNIIATARNKQRMQNLQDKYPHIQIIIADISTQVGRQEIAKSISQPLDYILHNAAMLDQPQNFEDIKLMQFRQNIATNVEPLIFLTQNLLDHLKRAKNNARILSVSSRAAQAAFAGIGSYCISKAAALMANEVLKVELIKYNILVNHYFPGVVDTKMQKTLRSSNDKIFPHSSDFKNLKSDNKLHKTHDVAEHIIDIFINSSDNLFSQHDWDFNAKVTK